MFLMTAPGAQKRAPGKVKTGLHEWNGNSRYCGVPLRPRTFYLLAFLPYHFSTISSESPLEGGLRETPQ